MDREPLVIFVCDENSNRSQTAEAFARIRGGGTVAEFSSGLRPSGRRTRQAPSTCAWSGRNRPPSSPVPPSGLLGQEFDAAVTMGCGDVCPLVHAKRRVDWLIPDPKELPPDQFNEVRDLIERKVKELLAVL